jgi:hypothetical protein
MATLQFQDLYGLGVRLGFYLQGGAYLISFIRLRNFSFASQLTGSILAFNTLSLWVLRTISQNPTQTYSATESWLAILLALSIAFPGSWVIYSVFVTEHAKLRQEKGRRIAKRELVRGRGIAVLQCFLSATGAIVAYIYFVSEKAFVNDDNIWIFGYHQMNSTFAKAFFIINSVILAPNLLLLVWLVSIWLLSVQSYLYPDRWTERYEMAGREDEEYETWETDRWKHLSPRNPGIYIAEFFIFGVYWAFLVVSVELTIQSNTELQPINSVIGQGQLIPLITGGFAMCNTLWAVARPDSGMESWRGRTSR